MRSIGGGGAARAAQTSTDFRPSPARFYAARPDKEYSLVDCMSMVVMKARNIDHVLTNDRHFSQEGFVVVSE